MFVFAYIELRIIVLIAITGILIKHITLRIEVNKLLSFKELSEKIETLESQKSQLIENMKELRKKAEEKLLFLECEVAVLREDTETLTKMLGTI